MSKAPLPEALEMLIQHGLLSRERAEDRDAFFDGLADAVKSGAITIEQAEAMAARCARRDAVAHLFTRPEDN
jgi:hypothetical protein